MRATDAGMKDTEIKSETPSGNQYAWIPAIVDKLEACTSCARGERKLKESQLLALHRQPPRDRHQYACDTIALEAGIAIDSQCIEMLSRASKLFEMVPDAREKALKSTLAAEQKRKDQLLQRHVKCRDIAVRRLAQVEAQVEQVRIATGLGEAQKLIDEVDAKISTQEEELEAVSARVGLLNIQMASGIA